jgi:hypothetical protein
MISKEDVWLWVLIAEKQSQLLVRLGNLDDNEFDEAESFLKAGHVADNETFLHNVRAIVEGTDDE